MRSNTLIQLKPRPESVHIGQGESVLAVRTDGQVDGGSERGLFVSQTRVLSVWRYEIAGQNPVPVALSAVEQHDWLGYYIHPTKGQVRRDIEVAPGTAIVELQVRRRVDGGLYETVHLRNYTGERQKFQFCIFVDADFADFNETREGERQQRGDLARTWRATGEQEWLLEFRYRAQHHYDHQGDSGTREISRGTLVRLRADSEASFENSRIAFDVELDPHQTWTAEARFSVDIDGHWFEPDPSPPNFDVRGDGPYDRWRNAYDDRTPRILTPGGDTMASNVEHTIERARTDLRAARQTAGAHDGEGWVPIAGVPKYTELFGRDSLSVAWQAAMLDTEMLRGTLRRLDELQGRGFDAWRDEEPGRFIHQASPGPLAALNYSPLGRYYGTMTVPTFYPVALAALWSWTGDIDAVERHMDAMLDGLRWLDTYGDRDGDGIYEYQTESEEGVKNQAWKDSDDAIVDEWGNVVDTPIAACETQGFAYSGKLAAAALCYWTGRREQARRFYQEAQTLKERFDELYWQEDLGFYAMALGPNDEPVRSVASNPAHCMTTGIVPEQKIEKVVERLFQSDMFSGWGIRTLSTQNPAYNPYSYHRGSVWPVENGAFVLGLRRVGLIDRAHELARVIFETASIFESHRLPEVFSGHQRDALHPFPAFYPEATSPQSWSASAVATVLEALIGFYPFAPLNVLFLDPALPPWLPEVRLQNLRVGDSRLSLHVWRDRGGRSHYDVERHEGSIHVVRQPSPWSLTATIPERARDLMESLLPHPPRKYWRFGFGQTGSSRGSRVKGAARVVAMGATAALAATLLFRGWR